MKPKIDMSTTTLLDRLCEELEFVCHGPVFRRWTLPLDQLLCDIMAYCGQDQGEPEDAREATRRRETLVKHMVPMLRSAHTEGYVSESRLAKWKLRTEEYDHCLHIDRNPGLVFADSSSEEQSSDFDSSSESEEQEEEEEPEESSSSSEEEEAKEGDCSQEEAKTAKRAADEALPLDDVSLKKAKTSVEQ